MSKAAGRPPDQFGIKMSAGLMEESGTKLGASLKGARIPFPIHLRVLYCP